jgi:hypothetical protein
MLLMCHPRSILMRSTYFHLPNCASPSQDVDCTRGLRLPPPGKLPVGAHEAERSETHERPRLGRCPLDSPRPTPGRRSRAAGLREESRPASATRRLWPGSPPRRWPCSWRRRWWARPRLNILAQTPPSASTRGATTSRVVRLIPAASTTNGWPSV